MLVAVGVYFTIRTRGVQIRLLKDGIKSLMEKNTEEENGKKKVSSFQALMISTASRVGTGNIAGIATAIAAGGPGAVFWMWLMAVIGGASAFAESTLAQVYKVKENGGVPRRTVLLYGTGARQTLDGSFVFRTSDHLFRIWIQRTAVV